MSTNHNFSLPSSSSQKMTAVVNLIAFAVMITTNCLSIFLPLNGKTQMQLSEQYANLFTPIGYTFSVWGFIYIFLFGFVVYQLLVLFIKRHRDKPRILAISPLFVGICLCNAGWLFAWHYQLVTLSVFIMLAHLWLLVLMHDKLSLAIAWQPLAPKIWLDMPFSIYLGWICVATNCQHNGVVRKQRRFVIFSSTTGMDDDYAGGSHAHRYFLCVYPSQ